MYGLITIFVGGSFLQYLFYAYSIGTLFAFLWALNIIKSVRTSHLSYRALFFVGGRNTS